MEDFWNPKIFIENAIGEPKVTSSLQVEYEGNDALILERKRFKGTFMEQMELWEFPFDMQVGLAKFLVRSTQTQYSIDVHSYPIHPHPVFYEFRILHICIKFENNRTITNGDIAF